MIINDRRSLSQFAALSMAVDDPVIARRAAGKVRAYRALGRFGDAEADARAAPGTVVPSDGDQAAHGYDAQGNVYYDDGTGQLYRTDGGVRYKLKPSGTVAAVDADGDELSQVEAVAASNAAARKSNYFKLALAAVGVGGLLMYSKGR